MRRLALSIVALLVAGAPASALVPPIADTEGRSIAYASAIYDQTDMRRLHIGTAGYWFPQFDAPAPVDHRPTRERSASSLPHWTARLNHYSIAAPLDAVADQGCTPLEIAAVRPPFFFRSFSQDGPAHSKGGQRHWSTITLPDARRGLSGAIVDPHTAGNRNNTVNRIQLHGDVPAVFYVHVLTNNTAGDHDPVHGVRARGNIGPLRPRPAGRGYGVS